MARQVVLELTNTGVDRYADFVSDQSFDACAFALTPAKQHEDGIATHQADDATAHVVLPGWEQRSNKRIDYFHVQLFQLLVGLVKLLLIPFRLFVAEPAAVGDTAAEIDSHDAS